MNGPEHYAEAEKWAYWAKEMHEHSDPDGAQAAASIGQVHATLALAAATVDAAELHTLEINGKEAMTEWGEVTA